MDTIGLTIKQVKKLGGRAYTDKQLAEKAPGCDSYGKVLSHPDFWANRVIILYEPTPQSLEVKEGQNISFVVDAFPDEEFYGTIIQVRLNPTVSSNVVTYTVVAKAENPEKKLMPGLTATVSIFTTEEYNVPSIEVRALHFKPDFDLIKLYNSQQKDFKPPAQDGKPPFTFGRISPESIILLRLFNFVTWKTRPIKSGNNFSSCSPN